MNHTSLHTDERNLTVEKLTLGWNNNPIVTNVSFCAEPGKILVIAGPNGSGKSTILKAIARQLRPLVGEVKLGETNIWDMPERQFARKVAYVPQQFQITHDLTVHELVALGRNPHQSWWDWNASAKDLEAIKAALEATQTAHLSQIHLANLSGGDYQRAVIATALAQATAVILLDEPTAHLDFRHQLELANLLLSLKSRGIAIVLVMHDLNLMVQLADTILLLAHPEGAPSNVIATGAPAKVFTAELLKIAYSIDVNLVHDAQTGQMAYIPTL